MSSDSRSEIEPVLAELNALCAEVSSRERVEDANVEEAYLSLLHFLREHQRSRPQLAAELSTVVTEFRNARRSRPRLSVDALAFCMHSLLWPEVLATAEREHDEYFAPRMDDFLWRLMDAYSPEWTEANDYSYYKPSKGTSA